MLDLLELGFVVVFLAGVALWWPPAALMLGGVLGVMACERRSGPRRTAVAADDGRPARRLRRVA
ncbi:hypothetical protein [Actinomadura alba]|uniref:Uncharacterized protein n=1 Tax=Actinomadura alba TaxID=406431 RepID=A0ABR7LHL5_9ACTN|nr:hypothetical protein [Actinomadura alba]MBC6464265.1 hypothetical protein [Actinomadura alba]